jgi:hypothetical protein
MVVPAVLRKAGKHVNRKKEEKYRGNYGGENH